MTLGLTLLVLEQQIALCCQNSAWVRFRNVGAKASVFTGGPSNAAMVVENSFWQQVHAQPFLDQPSAQWFANQVGMLF